ncbi:GAF and HD-GYP domain-containing protein [candidate division CSSED10-310 bacterium]|uniref:GAF and HD-GYP domain-containing protein n=1 Tax=candidate division CSSED10-310 bacterium TaxID=2855610 RepID=A0ABV6Z2M8_UNCC1
MENDSNVLAHILSISQEITQIKDVDLLLEKILTEARMMSNADAGSIYVKKEDKLHFNFAQNETLQRKLAPGKKLIFSRFSVPVNNQSIAGYVANNGKTVNIPDAYNLEKNLPFSFDQKYDELSCYHTHSILAFPLKTPQDEILGALQLINARDQKGDIIPFADEDEPFIMHFANAAAIALERAQMTRAIILRMLRMSEMRDPKETGSHVNRVGAIAAEIYETWATNQGYSTTEIEKAKDILRMTAMLHDVGKVAISDIILKKPARLNVDEFEIMKHHTFLGAKLFADSHTEFDKAAFFIALEHHERWDGNGYPGEVIFERVAQRQDFEFVVNKNKRKKGEEIHPFGRVVAIADVYDALSSKRVYKEAWDEATVMETIKSEAGKQFDPEMVKAFFEVFDVVRNIRELYPDH